MDIDTILLRIGTIHRRMTIRRNMAIDTILLHLGKIRLLGVMGISSPLASIEITTAQGFPQATDITLSGSLMPNFMG